MCIILHNPLGNKTCISQQHVLIIRGQQPRNSNSGIQNASDPVYLSLFLLISVAVILSFRREGKHFWASNLWCLREIISSFQTVLHPPQVGMKIPMEYCKIGSERDNRPILQVCATPFVGTSQKQARESQRIQTCWISLKNSGHQPQKISQGLWKTNQRNNPFQFFHSPSGFWRICIHMAYLNISP